MRSFFSLCVLLLVAAVHAISATAGDRLLVLLDNVAEKDAYSTFLGDLEGRGFKISYETPKSESLQLFHLGERSYDHILLLPTKVKALGPNLTPSTLVKFVNANGNILLATSATTTVSTTIVSLLAELDIAVPTERTGLVVDHFGYDTLSAPEKHDVLLLSPPGPLRAGLSSLFQSGAKSDEIIAFPSSLGHTLGPSAQLAPILRAPKSAYSYNPKEQGETIDPEELFAAGEQLALVSTFQGRNSARFTVVGSAEMLTNKWFDATVQKPAGQKVKTWNREFAKRVAGWTFQEIGVVRVNSVEHHLQEPHAEVNPKLYAILNNVTYTVSLSEYSWDKWTPYVVPEGDALQLEFSMLSPYYRLDLAPTKKTAEAAFYSVDFGLPDQHGIFNFKLNYKRPFLTNIEEKNTVSVRHIAHDEWPRSYTISGAWPWVSGLWVTIFGFLAFSAVWMYSAPPAKRSTKKTQ